MSAALKVKQHVWHYNRGPSMRGRWLFREATCLGCGDRLWHRADEMGPQDYACGAVAHEHTWVDEHIRELTMDGRQTIYAAQSCTGCRETRTVKRYRTPLPVGSTLSTGGKHG